MDISDLPSSIREVQTDLGPFIKSRPDITRIRRLLAVHLYTQLNPKSAEPILGPIALLHELDDANIATGASRGSRREYVKSLKANIKARREYELLRNQTINNNVKTHDPEAVHDFVTLVKLRQKHERLRILQNHVVDLTRKNQPALLLSSSAQYDSASLPQIPINLIDRMDSRASDPTGLEGLIQDLEKSILRAKSRLQEEKVLLSQAKKRHLTSESEAYNRDRDSTGTLQALGETRNELITWVEDELSKAGDSRSMESSANVPDLSPPISAVGIDDQISTIRRQYNRYLQARKDAIDALSHPEKDDISLHIPEFQDSEGIDTSTDYVNSNAQSIGPLLQDLTVLSNEQKTILQHRSYLTISLAKQHKDAIRIFDRLANESHLLPSHPLPSSREAAFLSDENTTKETPSAFHLAQAWAHASEAAGSATKDDVTENVDQGFSAIEESRRAILAINSLLGRDATDLKSKEKCVDVEDDEDDVWISETISHREDAVKGSTNSRSIWDSLEGNVGMIQE